MTLGRAIFILLCLALIVAGCNALNKQGASEQGVMAAALYTAQPSPTLMPLPTNSPTPDWKATAAVKELEIAQVNYETARLNNEAAQLENQVIMRTAIVEDWTATAAPTAIPLTATQQIIDDQLAANAQALEAQEQRLLSADMTARAEAPTQMVLMAKAEQQARMEPVWRWFWFGAAVVTLWVVLGSLTVWVRARAAQSTVEYIETEKPYTPAPAPNNQVRPLVIMTGSPSDPGSTEYSGAAPDEKLLRACATLRVGDKLPYNQLERAGHRRADIDTMRDWLLEREYAILTQQREVVILKEGERFFRGYKTSVTTPPPDGLQPIPG